MNYYSMYDYIYPIKHQSKSPFKFKIFTANL
jgi:hypothetical protein